MRTMDDAQAHPLATRREAAPQATGRGAVWDMTLPGLFSGLNDAGTLRRFHALGYRFVSITVANDTCRDPDLAVAAIEAVRAMAELDSDLFRIVRSASDVSNAVEAGQLALSFNFQGTNPFAGNIENVARFADLSLDHALLAYNQRNGVGDGCANFPGDGLTPFGRALIGEMNRCGVIVDGSHSGYRTTMEAMDLCAAPFIFSHSNACGVYPHYRNLRDDQIEACAASGGVIGVNGVGAFLSEDGKASAEHVFRHIDYLAALVGHEHVGLALDFIDRTDLFAERVAKETTKWPLNNGKPVRFDAFAEPRVVHDIAALMADHGYDAAQIRAILWGNFQRVYAAVIG